MDVKIANAAAAYAQRQIGAAPAAPPTEAPEASFSNLVKSAISGAVDSTRSGETVAMHALVNPGDLGQVVTAVTNAEMTMQTVVAVRDRVVQAYQDILRMPI